MGKLTRAMTAECLKFRRTWIFWIHLIIPFLGVTIFLLYYHAAGGSDWGKITAYIEALAVVCPSMVGIICGLAMEQEKTAGNLQNLFGVTGNREFRMAVKLIVLLLLNLAALFFAVVGFGAGFGKESTQTGPSGRFYFTMSLILWLPQIFDYLLHIYLGIRFSKGVTTGIGIVESLLAALLLTGLGDGIWKSFPCAWAVRFSSYYMLLFQEKGDPSFLTGEIKSGIIQAVLFVAAGGVLFFWAVHVYESSRIED